MGRKGRPSGRRSGAAEQRGRGKPSARGRRKEREGEGKEKENGKKKEKGGERIKRERERGDERVGADRGRGRPRVVSAACDAQAEGQTGMGQRKIWVSARFLGVSGSQAGDESR